MNSPGKKIKSLIGDEFVRNVITLMTGTILGQGLALLLSPIITRLFSPDDFAAAEQYTFLLSVFIVVVTGKYEFAILHPKDREDARHLSALAIKVATRVCIILLLILLFTSSFLADFLHQESLKYWLWTLPIALFSMAVFNTINFWFSREKQFKISATSKIIYSVTGEPFKIAAGWFQAGTGGLIIGTVIGHISSAWYSWKKFLAGEPLGIRKLNKKRLKELAAEHSDYPRYAIWGGILNTIAQWAHVAVFLYFYEEKAIIPIGMIALSRRIFFVPLGVLSTSYGQVFYQKISEIENPVELRDYYIKIFMRFMALATIIVLAVQVLPANTLGIIFGQQWAVALIYLKILSYWYALNFVISTLSFIFYILKLQWYTLVADIFHFIIVTLAFWYAFHSGKDEVDAIRIMVVAKMIYLVLNGLAIMYFLQRNCNRKS